MDDFEPWCRAVRALLERQSAVQVIGEAGDGFGAIQKAQELQPDLILLDICLPKLDGIEAARRIREVSPKSKILFVSQEYSADVVQAAFRAGADGYVVKGNAGRDLLTAVNTVLGGESFLGARFAGHEFFGLFESQASRGVRSKDIIEPSIEQRIHSGCHQVGLYPDDRSFLHQLTQFVSSALEAGNAAIVVATESHRINLLATLDERGLDMGRAIEQGRYIALNAADAVSKFVINGLPDPARFLQVADNLITAAKYSSKEPVRVAICGECDPPIWELGEAAIQFEQLWNVVAARYDVDILCGYPLSTFHNPQVNGLLRRLCAEHSAVHSW